MKKLLILLVLPMIVFGCAEKPKVEEKDDFLKVYETPETQNVQNEPEVKTYTPIYQQATSSMSPTYWYVTFEEQKVDSKGEVVEINDWHRAIQIDAPYFDFVLARQALPAEVTGKCFFDFIVQINKESYESHSNYRRMYFNQ